MEKLKIQLGYKYGTRPAQQWLKSKDDRRMKEQQESLTQQKRKQIQKPGKRQGEATVAKILLINSHPWYFNWIQLFWNYLLDICFCAGRQASNISFLNHNKHIIKHYEPFFYNQFFTKLVAVLQGKSKWWNIWEKDNSFSLLISLPTSDLL